jgi:hypothetical protein
MHLRKIIVWACFATTAILGGPSSVAMADSLGLESGLATVTGSPVLTNGFTTTTGNISCSSASYTGTVSNGSAFMDVQPSYSGCTCFGFPCTIDVNGCKYRMWVLGAATFGEVDIICAGSNSITATATAAGTTKCTVHIPSQNGLSSTNLSNSGSGATREVTVSYFSINTVAYSHTKGTGLGACTAGSGFSGSMSGSVRFTAEVGFTHTGLYLQ